MKREKKEEWKGDKEQRRKEKYIKEKKEVEEDKEKR